MSRRVVLYGLPACVQCKASARKLDALGVAFEYVDLAADGEALARVRALGHRQAPVVLVVDGGGREEAWSGHRPDRLDTLAAA